MRRVRTTWPAQQERAFWRSLSGIPLNGAQREAVRHVDGPALCLAGPGAGKTTVLTLRTAFLVEVAAVAPRDILLLTFTRAARDQMRERLSRRLGPQRAGAIRYATFHSLAYGALRQVYRSGFRLLAEAEQRRWLERLLVQAGTPVDAETVELLMQEMSYLRNALAEPENFRPRSCSPSVFRQVLAAYQEAKRAQGYLDFDDLLVEFYALLRRDPQPWRRFRRVLVDEFQDTSPLQYVILRLLAEPEGHLFVVGDEDQSIYGWRGASPRLLLRFSQDFPGCRRFELVVNYRSTPQIVAAANRLIAHNQERFPKVIQTPRPAGPEPELWQPVDPLDEAARVAAALTGELQAARARRPRLGVIYRTNTQAYPLVQLLARQGVPFAALGGLDSLYQHWVAQDVLAYLHCAGGRATDDHVARILNKPGRYLSGERIEEARRLAQREGRPLLDVLLDAGLEGWKRAKVVELCAHLQRLGRLPAREAIRYVRHDVGYGPWLHSWAEQLGRKPGEYEAILDVLEALAPPDQPITVYLEEAGTVSRRLQAGTPAIGSRERLPGAAPGEVAVGPAAQPGGTEATITLTTCHSAKGLEFDTVFVIGVVEGVLPHVQAGESLPAIEEERRLFYVAITRARRRLVVSAPSHGFTGPVRPSRFLAEAFPAFAAGSGQRQPGEPRAGQPRTRS